MKRIMQLLLIPLAVMLAAPTFAAQSSQFWRCEMDDDTSEERVKEIAQKWLKAAKTVDGGANLEVYVMFPVAVNATGEMDFMFIVSAPSFAEWGRFWDAYAGSAAAEADKGMGEDVVCPDSSLWEGIKIEAK